MPEPESNHTGDFADSRSCIYFLSSCDTDIVKNNSKKVVELLRTYESCSDEWKPVLFSSRRQLTSLVYVHGYPQYFVTLCRRYNLLKNDRVTLLSPMDQLIAIQLCLAEKNKQESGDYDVEVSVVLQASKDIINKKLLDHYDVTSCTQESGICTLYDKFLEDCNYMDTCDVFKKVMEEAERNEELKKELIQQCFIFLDPPKTATERKMVEFLCVDKAIKSVTVEVPLDSDDNISVACDNSCLATILDRDIPLNTVKKPPSMTETYVRLMYLSYLDLLVNSRSELALARVFNVPERELTHSAFTDLKHVAQEKKMSMYQTAISFIMKIRLGGKGYAADVNRSSLQTHVKGIGEFVTLMQRMETVIEEDSDIRSACRKTVNIIRKEMVKCRDSKIRKTSVESVAEQLYSQITSVIDMMDAQVVNTPDKAAANGGSLTSRRARKALRHLLDKLSTVDDDMSSLDHLTDIYSSQRTPLRFPSVVSQFRSPEEELEVTSPENKYNMSLTERVMNNVTKQQTPVYAKRYKSTCDWAEPVHKVDLTKDDNIFSESQVYVIPTKTIVHAGSKLSSGEANKVLESLLDQENAKDTDITLVPITNNQSAAESKSSAYNNKGASKGTNAGNKKPAANKQKSLNNNTENQSKKRQLENETQSSQPQKKKKQDQSKSCRRKLLPQVKGQQQLTKFFRV